MFKKRLSYAIIALSLVGVILLSIGFYQAMKVTMVPQRQQSALATLAQPEENSSQPVAKNANSLQVLILGDSIAKGTGDEKGLGFSGYLSQSFRNNTSKDIVVNNVGTDGLESLGLLTQLQNSNLDQVIAQSNIILISIGGNDLRRIISANDIGKEEAFKTKLDNYASNLKETLTILRNNNSHALIVVLGIYNPYEGTTNTEDNNLLNEWNYGTEQLITNRGKVVFIPTYDLMKYNLSKYLAPDGLHPNSAGYQALSNRISKSIESIIAGS